MSQTQLQVLKCNTQNKRSVIREEQTEPETCQPTHKAHEWQRQDPNLSHLTPPILFFKD